MNASKSFTAPAFFGPHNEHEFIVVISGYMGGCQNYGPFLDPYYNTAPTI